MANRSSSIYDRGDSFGWISIALHWTTAIAIITLWFIGKSISSQTPDEIDARRSLHITVGLLCWLPIAVRIVWRIVVPHPHAVGQSMQVHKIARFAHFTMLAVLCIMLLTGPLMAWVLQANSDLFAAVFYLHSLAASILAFLVLVHILGSLKHLMFHDDETIARMIWPRPNTMTSTKQQKP